MLSARDISGTLRALKGISVRDAGGALRTVATVYVRDAANVLRAVFTSGSVTASPTTVAGYVNSKATRPAITSPISLTINGGAAPYTIAWSFDDTGWAAVSPGSISTSFRSPPLSGGDYISVNIVATVTDANGTVFTSNSVFAYAQNTAF